MSKLKKQQMLIDTLSEACQELGWVIGICADDEETEADGLIIGPQEFVYQTLALYEQEYSVVAQGAMDENMVELEPSTPKPKKVLH